MKIGILYICTGKYDIFFEEFYASCEKNFLPNHEKTYYVWTDSKKESLRKDRVVTIYQEKQGWPYDTLIRFKLFTEFKEILLKNDYLFFLNANMVIHSKVGEEIIPKEENGFLMGVEHPGFINQEKEKFPYERNEKSQFYMKEDEGEKYFQGCFNGGAAKNFLDLSSTLDEMVDKDLDNNIMPRVHDESALNWYFKNNPPLVLHPGYAYPEGWKIAFDKKIIQLDKSKRGGHKQLRS